MLAVRLSCPKHTHCVRISTAPRGSRTGPVRSSPLLSTAVFHSSLPRCPIGTVISCVSDAGVGLFRTLLYTNFACTPIVHDVLPSGHPFQMNMSTWCLCPDAASWTNQLLAGFAALKFVHAHKIWVARSILTTQWVRERAGVRVRRGPSLSSALSTSCAKCESVLAMPHTLAFPRARGFGSRSLPQAPPRYRVAWLRTTPR